MSAADRVPAVEFHGVTKDFGSTRALCDAELTVPPGQVVALLGPKGAGTQ
jgi:ABC-type multidrug transport system ATPase subunit